ncbi:transcription initiation factor TFIID subunit 4-like [Antennarius striatus]|uniref:transcription initiation factor TFIID subunit 4-like n=1 Tax=Antennarius striatus TaxID=241820 RepID=UPI0035B116FF
MRIGEWVDSPPCSCVSAGGVISSPGSHALSMDGTASAAAAAAPSLTAAQSQSKLGAGSGVAPVPPDGATGAGKTGTTGAETFNGSTAGMDGPVPADSNGDVPLVDNGAGAGPGKRDGASGTIVRTSSGVHTAVISSPVSGKTLPTVTLVRPPMQTPSRTSPVLTPPAPSGTAGSHLQTGGQVVVSAVATGATTTPRTPSLVQNVRASVPATTAAASGGIRAITPQVLAPRLPQPQPGSPNIQNIHLPPGMVLVRSESGQLLMIHQQALAQMQAQTQSQSAMTPRPAAPTTTTTPPVQITSLQAPSASLLPRPITPTTIIKQASAVQTTVTATTTLQRPPVLQNAIVLGGAVTAPGQTLGAPATTQPGPATAAQRVGPLATTGAPVTAAAITTETLENVKKCQNFLSTLIKLASSGKRSSETTANVKELVKSLLEAKLEPEDFTSKLYKELNSSPQPCLVPFLKRSIPALRQMTPDSEAFIQQSLQPPAGAGAAAGASTTLKAVMLQPPLSTAAAAAATATSITTTKATVISLSQLPHSKPGMIVPQQQGATSRTQVTLTQPPMITLRGQPHSRIIVGQPQVVKQLQSGVIPAAKHIFTPGAKGVQVISQTALTAAQKNKLKEAGGGTFRDDDDINDVASMAGVNLSEESANILATNSELVGAVTRSCKDESFLSTFSLSRRVLEIGKRFGVGELGTDVVNFISHATQQRLQNLLEKVSQVAQMKNMNFKEDDQYQLIGDVRAQLKFFEQLDQAEKQRKEEVEREILLKAAKSRSRQEDPEQLRLKQKAKEMQQQELAQIRQREANLTALAAIGPRKKRRTDSPLWGNGAEGSGSGSSQPGGSGGAGSRHFIRQRITRVNLRDLLFCLENERGTSRSKLLYRGFLK